MRVRACDGVWTFVLQEGHSTNACLLALIQAKSFRTINDFLSIVDDMLAGTQEKSVPAGKLFPEIMGYPVSTM